jgi:predicted metal-dependent phosphoesterase TrpH
MLFEIHCHSTYSDGTATPKEIVAYAKSLGLSGIAITDHDIIEGSLEAVKHSSSGFAVVPGMEVSSEEGHILALNVRELIPRDISAKDTINRIHSLGGIAVAAHPYDLRRRGVGDLITRLPFDAVEVMNGHTFGSKKDPKRICEGLGISMVGGSDAHTLNEVGSVLVEYDGADAIESIKSGNVRIRSRSMAYLLLNHGVGLIKRKSAKALKRVGKH